MNIKFPVYFTREEASSLAGMERVRIEEGSIRLQLRRQLAFGPHSEFTLSPYLTYKTVHLINYFHLEGPTICAHNGKIYKKQGKQSEAIPNGNELSMKFIDSRRLFAFISPFPSAWASIKSATTTDRLNL